MLFALLKSLARVRHFSSYAYFLIIFLSFGDEIPNTSADSQSLTLSEKKMQNGKQNKYNAQTMTNTSMQKLWEIFHLLQRHQRRRMSSTAVHPSIVHGVPHAAVGGGALPGAPPLPLPRLHHHQLPPVAVQPSGSKRFEPKTLQDCFVGTFANLCPVTNCPYLR